VATLYSGRVTSTRRPYRSRLREEQAARTRAVILGTATDLFAEKGWSGTGLRAVADAAGVSEATVYAAFGSKAGLALALVDAADGAAGVERVRDELAQHRDDPAAQLAVLVAFDRRLFTDGGGLIALLDEGRHHSAELAAAYRDGRARGDAGRRALFASWPPHVWRAGVDADAALDTYAAVCTYATFRVLRDERGWDADRIERWWVESLRLLLLA
jgi:AcrR family transcriptional regulator